MGSTEGPSNVGRICIDVHLRWVREGLDSSRARLALPAAGRSDARVQDRTGHPTSAMINRYRRKSRSAKEVGLGGLAPMDLVSRGGPAGSKTRGKWQQPAKERDRKTRKG